MKKIWKFFGRILSWLDRCSMVELDREREERHRSIQRDMEELKRRRPDL